MLQVPLVLSEEQRKQRRGWLRGATPADGAGGASGAISGGSMDYGCSDDGGGGGGGGGIGLAGRGRRRRRTEYAQLRRITSSAAAAAPWWCKAYWKGKLAEKGIGAASSSAARIEHTAGVGLLPVLQFGSFLATRVVREAALYAAAPFALHATHIVGSGIVFMRNNLKTMGACAHPVKAKHAHRLRH